MADSSHSRLMAVTLLTALGLAGCNRDNGEDPRTNDRIVETTHIEHATGDTRRFTGLVAARVQSDLGFRIQGKIVERLVDTGQTVTAGQVLMRLDPTDYTHALATQAGDVASARARWTKAAADERRYRGLVATGAASALQYDEVKATADSAKALLDAAIAQEKIARNQDDYSLLRADADGVIVQTLEEPGHVVAAGQTVMVLAHAGPREASVPLPEGVRPSLGSQAEARIYNGATSVPAHLRQLSDAADPVARTFEARYVLDGEDAHAPLGMTVQVTIPQADAGEDIQVPLGSIDDEGQGAGVWVVDPKTSVVSFHPVRVIRLTEENAVLARSADSDLSAGRMIVAVGGHYLHPAEHVKLANEKVAMQ